MLLWLMKLPYRVQVPKVRLMPLLRIILILPLLMSFSMILSVAYARQINFNLQQNQNHIEFAYRYETVQGNTRNLSFQLDEQLLIKSNNTLLSFEKITKIAGSQAINGLKKASEKSRMKVQAEYEALYQQALVKVANANRQLAPFYDVEVNRSGSSDFGIKQDSNHSAVVRYFWQTPSLEIKTNAINDIRSALSKAVAQKNKELAGKAILKLRLQGARVGLELKVTNANYNQIGRNAFNEVQNTMDGLIRKQNLASNLSKQHFNQITGFIKNGLRKLQISAEKEMDSFQLEYRRLRNDVLKDYNLVMVKNGRDDVIRIDYQKIVSDYRLAMRPPIQAAVNSLTNNNDLRSHIENALNFVQTIPYDRLEQRNFKGLAGFLLPPSMIQQNRGDCDTKSVALLAMLGHIMPASAGNNPLIMVLIPGHAFIGAKISPKSDDKVYRYNNVPYVLMEVAGPALFPIGKLSDMSERALRQNKIIEIIPIGA